MTERLLTAAELGEVLGFAAGTVVDWAENGTIPAFKIGGRLRFRESEVLAWLEQRRLAKPDGGGETPVAPPRPAGLVSEMPVVPSRGGRNA